MSAIQYVEFRGRDRAREAVAAFERHQRVARARDHPHRNYDFIEKIVRRRACGHPAQHRRRAGRARRIDDRLQTGEQSGIVRERAGRDELPKASAECADPFTLDLQREFETRAGDRLIVLAGDRAHEAEGRTAFRKHPEERKGDEAPEGMADDRRSSHVECIEYVGDVGGERFHQIRSRRRARAAESTQIETNHARSGSERTRLRVPYLFGEREAVEKHDRRASAFIKHVESRAVERQMHQRHNSVVVAKILQLRYNIRNYPDDVEPTVVRRAVRGKDDYQRMAVKKTRKKAGVKKAARKASPRKKSAAKKTTRKKTTAKKTTRKKAKKAKKASTRKKAVRKAGTRKKAVRKKTTRRKVAKKA